MLNRSVNSVGNVVMCKVGQRDASRSWIVEEKNWGEQRELCKVELSGSSDI
jgi:hypothetical protein